MTLDEAMEEIARLALVLTEVREGAATALAEMDEADDMNQMIDIAQAEFERLKEVR